MFMDVEKETGKIQNRACFVQYKTDFKIIVSHPLSDIDFHARLVTITIKHQTHQKPS